MQSTCRYVLRLKTSRSNKKKISKIIIFSINSENIVAKTRKIIAQIAIIIILIDFVVCLPDSSFASLLMAFYSYVPILLFFICLTLFIANRTASSFMATFLFVVSVVFGEILKQIIRQKRPDGTCACRLVLLILYYFWSINRT